MNPPPKPGIQAFSLRADAPALCLLVVVIALAWIGANSKWTATDWDLPGAYLSPRESDVIGMLATFRAAADGHFVPLGPKKIPELGAPGVADWADNPVVEEILFWGTGLLARWTGLFAALNIKLMLAHLLAGISFFFVARYFQALRAWAFAGALAFGLAPFVFSESPHHSNVAIVWHVPFFLIVWRWAISPGGIVPWGKNFWLALALAFVTGLQNIYYTNIFCQLTLLCGAVSAWRGRRWSPLLGALGVIGGSALAFTLMAFDTLAYRLHEGPNPLALARAYHWLEIYALKLVDLFVPPPTHQLDFLAQFSAAHARKLAIVNEGSYLGVLGIVSLCSLVFLSARAAISRGRIPVEFWQVLWIFVVFTTGGLNTIVGVFGLTLFRAGYRVGIVILAVVLLFFVRKVSRWPGGSLSTLLAVLASAVVLVDQVPRSVSPEAKALIALQIESDREFTREMERLLPEGAMIFQLPAMDYPESPVPGITPYEHLRPYLYSRTLRFSFGSVKGRGGRMLQPPVSGEDYAAFADDLQRQGFAAIFINLRGYRDGGREILASLSASGYRELVQSKTGDLLLVKIAARRTPP